MKHCSSPVWHRPPPGTPSSPGSCAGWLLPQIVCCERRTLPCFCAKLDLFGLADGAQHLTFVSLAPSSDPPVFTQTGPADGCGRIPVCVSIPVSVTLCNPCGQFSTASSVVDAEIWLPASFAPSWQHRVLILPRLSPGCAKPCVCCGKLEIQLHVELECYLLRLNPCYPSRLAPSCPDLPLYPQPHCR